MFDLVIEGGFCGMEPTTVVDLCGEMPRIIREGKGDPTPSRLNDQAVALNRIS